MHAGLDRRISRRRLISGLTGLGASGVSLWLANACGGGSSPTARRGPWRVGLLNISGVSGEVPNDFLRALHDLGYRDQDLVIDGRSADELDLLDGIAFELLALHPDVIVAGGAPALKALGANKDIPTVALLPLVDDPVDFGSAESLNRPGGNVTGLIGTVPGVWGKRLELLKEAVPRASRLAVMWNSLQLPPFATWDGLGPARALGLEVLRFEVPTPDAIDAAFEGAVAADADTFAWIGTAWISGDPKRVAELALKSRLPSISDLGAYSRLGGLMAYAGDISDWLPRAAGFVDKILKGQKPADIPFERPTKFQFSINLRTAAALGLELPRSILLQATEVLR